MPTLSSVSGGPYFDDLSVGLVFDSAPAVTLTAGGAAVHQAILADRLRLSLDESLSRAVTGSTSALAHPGYVCDIAIGQSTLVTQRVTANLFYRGLRFHRFPVLGDTLYTQTEVVGLKQNSVRSDRTPTGLAALRITTVDQDNNLVLDFHRCAMLPLAPDAQETGYEDDLSLLGTDAEESADPTSTWNADAFRAKVPGPHLSADVVGETIRSTADVVSGAPELARLTLNIAATHHDSRFAGQRLVYGGHTIGLALAQILRAFPNIATVLAWTSCDHTAPVREGDTLYSDIQVEAAIPLPAGRGLKLQLRSVVYAVGDVQDRQVLDWRFTALHF